MTASRFIAAVLLGSSLLARPVNAQQSTSSKAAAEALFQQATDLFAAGDFVKACQKFEASGALEPALGTRLRLADCLDRIGKTASAWALFREAAAIAQNRGETERASMATERAEHLEPRLSKLELHLSGSPPAGLEVRFNGDAIPTSSIDISLPVDPGSLTVTARAPGRKTWSRELTVPDGPATTTLQVPELEVAKAPPQAATSGPARARVQDRTRDPGATTRTAGFIAGGLGLLGLAGGGVMAWRARDLNSQSLPHCEADDPAACDEQGHALREDAFRFADAATVSLAAGGGLLLGGIVLVLVAPSEAKERGARVSVATSSVRGGAALGLAGAW